MSMDGSSDPRETVARERAGAVEWWDAVRSLASSDAGDPGVTKGVLSRIAERDGEAAGASATRLLCVLAPGRSDAWLSVVDFEVGRENWRTAATAGMRALASGTADPALAHRLAATAYRAGLDETVVRLCDAAERAGSDQPSAGMMFLRGRALVRLGRVAEGRATLARTATLDATFEFAVEVLGYAMTDADFAEARAAVAGPSTGGGDLDG